jgi:membrane protease YdiL (CAAX protease family)
VRRRRRALLASGEVNVRSATAPESNLRDVSRRKLAWWSVFIAPLIALEYAANLSSSATQRASQDVLYTYSAAIEGAVVYLVWLGIILWIAGSQRQLFALRQPKSWPRGLGLAVVTLAGSYVAIRLMDPFLHAGREQGLVPTHWEPSHAGAFAANWVVVGGVAPVVEEMTFRGLGYSLVVARWGRPVAIVAVGLLFAGAHGLLQAFPELAALGCALGWLRARTDSIYLGILAHATFNSLALAAVMLG